MDNVMASLATGKLNSYVAVILMFTYSIVLDKEFACACGKQELQCGAYMAVPCVVIVVLILWTDKLFYRMCSPVCKRCELVVSCGSFLCQIVKAFLVGALWAAFVLIDGDWYVCCAIDLSEEQRHLACKIKNNLNETERITMAQMKSSSRCIGGIVLLGLILVGFTMSLCGSSRCRRFKYDNLILEEEPEVVLEILRNSVKEKLTQKVQDAINTGCVDNCWDVATELIKEERQQQQEGQGQQDGHGQQEEERLLLNV